MRRNLILRNSMMPIFSLEKEFEDFFNSFYDPAKSSDLPQKFRVDFLNNEKEYTLFAEIPGVDKEDIKVEEQKGILTISAEKKEDKSEEEKSKNYLRREISFGKYERSLKMPEDADFSKVSAKYENGILTVSIPKQQELNKVNKITIQ